MGGCNSTSHSPYAEARKQSAEAAAKERKILYAILPLSNPVGFESRKRLFLETTKALCTTRALLAAKSSGPQLSIVACELAYDDQPFVSESKECHLDMTIKLRAPKACTLWSKENLINIAIEQLPADAHYVAWLDTDIQFNQAGWVESTIFHLDQKPGFVQLFEDAEILGPSKEVLYVTTSFAKQLASGKTLPEPTKQVHNQHPQYWHPGFAWASTVPILKHIGLLPEKTLGGADRHLAMALINRVAETVPATINQEYHKAMLEMQRKIQNSSYRNLSYLQGVRIKHFWHGSYVKRQYVERWTLLAKANFDPSRHVKRRDDGLLIWSEDVPHDLPFEVYNYFEQRDEDSNDIASSEYVPMPDSGPGPSDCPGPDTDHDTYQQPEDHHHDHEQQHHHHHHHCEGGTSEEHHHGYDHHDHEHRQGGAAGGNIDLQHHEIDGVAGIVAVELCAEQAAMFGYGAF
jgi:hypothetical protein